MAGCSGDLKGLVAGQAVGRRSWFFDEDGLPWDPPAIDVKLIDPAGTVTNPTPTQEATGVYMTVFELDAAGKWTYQIKPQGGLNRVDEGFILVGRSVA